MKTLTFAAVVAAALGLAAEATAKEVRSLTICGATGCKQVKDARDLHAYVAGDAAAPVPPSRYYEVRATVEGDGKTISWTSYYVPAANVLAAVGGDGDATSWIVLPETSRTLFATATAGLDPFPRPKVTAAFVGGRKVRGDASTYARLLSLPAKFAPYPADWDWLGVDLRSDRTTPWTASTRDLIYSPSANLLECGPARVPVPPSLAADVEAARALDAGSTFPWPALVLAIAASLSAGALLVLALRRRTAPRGRPVPTT